MSPYDLASLDGTVLPTIEATVPVTDEGLLRGDGVFEVVRLYDGVPFAWDEHLERMTASAVNLRLGFDAIALDADVSALLAAASPGDCAMRCLATRGGRRIVLLEPLTPMSAPVQLATVTYAPTRILDGVKSLSYGANMLATRLAQERGGDEALLVTPHGRVLEAPTSSFFYVLDDGDVYTPPLEDHVLDSITRRHVLEVTSATEWVTAADSIPLMTEAFLASTLREVQSVSGIDGHAMAAPGPRTAEIVEAVGAHIRARVAR